jgi:hypothetical protein
VRKLLVLRRSPLCIARPALDHRLLPARLSLLRAHISPGTGLSNLRPHALTSSRLHAASLSLSLSPALSHSRSRYLTLALSHRRSLSLSVPVAIYPGPRAVRLRLNRAAERRITKAPARDTGPSPPRACGYAINVHPAPSEQNTATSSIATAQIAAAVPQFSADRVRSSTPILYMKCGMCDVCSVLKVRPTRVPTLFNSDVLSGDELL